MGNTPPGGEDPNKSGFLCTSNKQSNKIERKKSKRKYLINKLFRYTLQSSAKKCMESCLHEVDNGW